MGSDTDVNMELAEFQIRSPVSSCRNLLTPGTLVVQYKMQYLGPSWHWVVHGRR